MSDHGQVQLRLPLQPPATASEARCGSPAAHISLRRFAQGYIFGSTTRLGTNVVNIQPTSQQGASTAFNSSDSTDFATCAKKTEVSLGETRKKRCPVQEVAPVVEVGSNGRVPALAVRSRVIERKPVPKRGREAVSVDALAAMMDRTLGSTETAGWRKKGGLKRLRSAEGKKTGAAGAFGSCLEWEVNKEPEEEKEENVEKLEEQDTTDELSFLVEKCELDEGKESMFMPYIT